MHARVCNSYVNPDDHLEIVPESEITCGIQAEVTALKYVLYA